MLFAVCFIYRPGLFSSLFGEQGFDKVRENSRNHQFSASAVELEFLRSERRLRSGRHFA
jgi:hypothetical protein